MIHIISKDLSNIEELKKIKTEKTVKDERSRILMKNLVDIRSVEKDLYPLNIQKTVE